MADLARAQRPTIPTGRHRYGMLRGITACFLLMLLFSSGIRAAENEPTDAPGLPAEWGERVWLLPIEGDIDLGLPAYVERVLAEAEDDNASSVVIELRTLGGRVDAALEIRDLLVRSPLPTVVLVKDRALSAGVLIALAGDRLYMLRGSTIGAAEPRPNDAKTVSAWRAELEDTAEINDRDRKLAAAMADASVTIPEIKEETDTILTLTAAEAVRLNFADGLVQSRQELLQLMNADVVAGESALTSGERLARWVTSPWLAPVLLIVGVIGLGIEIFAPGFGIPGLIGLLGLGLYFGGHLLAGYGGWEAVLLFVVGLAALATEIFLPGFGIFGVGGLVALGFSLVLLTPDWGQAFAALGIAILATLAIGIYLLRTRPGKTVWRGLFLQTSLDQSGGYIAPRPAEGLVGQTGVALTPLRPSGTATIGDRRYDVVSEGSYIEAHRPIIVVAEEGVRLVVREQSSDMEE